MSTPTTCPNAPIKTRKRPHAQIRPAGYTTPSSTHPKKKPRKTYYQQPIWPQLKAKAEASSTPPTPLAFKTPLNRILNPEPPPQIPAYYTPDPSKPSILHRFPPEINCMIFTLVLARPNGVRIRSPVLPRRGKDSAQSRDAGALLRVDKKIHFEARPIFFAVNTFRVGNAMYGDSKAENLYALQAFVKKTPESYLSMVRGVKVEMWLLESGWDRSGDALVEEGYRDQIKDITSIIRILKRFTGVKSVDVGFVNWWRNWEEELAWDGDFDRPSKRTREMDALCENALFLKKATTMLQSLEKIPEVSHLR